MDGILAREPKKRNARDSMGLDDRRTACGGRRDVEQDPHRPPELPIGRRRKLSKIPLTRKIRWVEQWLEWGVFPRLEPTFQQSGMIDLPAFGATIPGWNLGLHAERPFSGIFFDRQPHFRRDRKMCQPKCRS